MRTMILILAGASAIALASQPAQAQDFTGPRVEVNAGYDRIGADDGVAGTPNSVDGARIGGVIGYDLPVGGIFTIGAEAGVGFTVSGSAEGTAGTTSYRATAGRDLDASVRIGARVTPGTLVFVKGGYANSQFRLRTTLGGTAGNTVTNVRTEEDGWRIGAGVEQALGEHIYAKAEYRYTDYGSDVSRHQALVGLGYRF